MTAMVVSHTLPTVLVVDDSVDHRTLIERRLSDSGWDVRLSCSGEEALEMLDGVDLVLLDYRLPGLSGLETLERIQRVHGPSVVMVTGMGSESVAVEAMRAGAIDYLVKDTGYLRTLPEAVARAWRHHDLRRRAEELQRLALLTTSAAGRPEMFASIVEGTRQVMRAEACSLHVAKGGDMSLEAASGNLDLLDTTGPGEIVDALARPAPAAYGEGLVTDRLLLPVPGPSGESLGILAVLSTGLVQYAPEELELARTFAAFAGISLANLHRLELERELVVELQNMLDVRQRFVTHVSHELRTPLTCVQGFASTLLDHWAALDEGQQRTFVAKIDEHGRELGELVEHLLDFASLEAGGPAARTENLDLADEVQSVLVSLGPLLRGRQVTVSGAAPKVRADPNLLRSTVRNLVSNAVKYSGRGTEIAVRLGHDDQGMARVELADQGRGLTSAELARIFEPFWRSPSVGMGPVRGTGIGLTLVREYVRSMGGEVGVESEAGHGSTFWFTLPLAG